MSENSPRVRRLADRIQQIVATMLDTRVKDPRLGFITITEVRVTGDLQHATIFYTVFGDEEERAGTAAALTSATGMLRREVGRQTGVRLTPTLEFVEDALPENARTIEDLLVQARSRDADLARQQEGASFAGESDPYRKPREEPEDGDEEADEVADAGDAAAEDAGAAGDPRA